MAGIDKLTTMRRMALIYPGGNISYEGVNIEGQCIVLPVGGTRKDVVMFKESQADDFARKYGLEVKYQDPEGEDYWEPRVQKGQDNAR
jgi:hypothetical protein